MRQRFDGLWRHPDFVRLWAGQTVSVFGTMIGGAALPFTAILVLDASPLEVAVLAACGIVPGLLFGLAAGVWVDRLRRRPLMIAADIGRALALATVPLAWAFDALRIEQLYAVNLSTGLLTTLFDVAYRSYLPTLIEREQLLEGNAKLSASNSVAEFAGFSASGWLVQLLSGPLAILADALTFVVSFASIRAIRAPEPAPAPREDGAHALRDAAQGLRTVARHALLRTTAGATVLYALGFGMFGATYMLFVTRGLGFDPGVLGVIFGIGGLSSLAGSLLAAPLARTLGVGPSMIFGVLLMGGSMLLIPLAPDASALGAAFLIAQQISGDGAFTAYSINEMSLRQSVAPEEALGRVNALMYILELGFTLAGTLLGGWIGQTAGLRPALVTGALCTAAAAAWMSISPVRSLRRTPAAVAALTAADV